MKFDSNEINLYLGLAGGLETISGLFYVFDEMAIQTRNSSCLVFD